MEERIYTITLSDGTALGNIRMNGTNFVSSSKVTEATFSGKLRTVTVDDGENQTVMEHCELVQITKISNKEYWFVLRQLSKEEVAMNQLQANIDYIAAMTDVEL